MPSEMMERRLGVTAPPTAPPSLADLTDELNRLDVEYHAALAERDAQATDLAGIEQRIRNGERDVAARRSRQQAVPPSWAALLAELRVRRQARVDDVAEAEARAEAVLGTFTARLGRYEYRYDLGAR